jgi:hypothetical protein
VKKSKKETSVKAVSKKKLSIDVEAKNKGGRHPVVLSDEQIKEVEELAAYFTIEQIAEYFDICADTFYEIKKRQHEVFRVYKKGRMRKIYRYAKILENKAFGMNENEMLKYDTTSIIFFLKTQAGWSEKQELNVNTKDVTPQLQRFNIMAGDEDHKPDSQ